MNETDELKEQETKEKRKTRDLQNLA